MKAMMTSISEVMETMFFLPVEPDQEATLSGCGLGNETRYACRLSFNGEASGNLTVIAPKHLVSEMAENFMGEDRDLLTDDHLSGSLAEMLNMVCGNALSKTESTAPFELSIPEVIDGTRVPEKEVYTIIRTSQSRMAILLSID